MVFEPRFFSSGSPGSLLTGLPGTAPPRAFKELLRSPEITLDSLK
jgi:hypothetical protein